MPKLILGPLLRYTGESDATIWVETDAACEVEVRVEEAVHRSRTFRIEDHHYALVHVSGLASDAVYEYSVDLGGVQAWPEPDSAFPPSTIRTLGEKEPLGSPSALVGRLVHPRTRYSARGMRVI